MPTVGQEALQLCTRKVDHNEARRLSNTFGKDELSLGIAQSTSGPGAEPAPLDHDEAKAACAGTTVQRRVQSLKSVVPRSVGG
jgi:hypothetical protein